MLEKFGERCEKFVRAFMPDPFSLVLILTIIAFGLALWVMGTNPKELVSLWNAGFWEILVFTMQTALIVMLTEAISESRIVQRSMSRLTSVPTSPMVALFLLAILSTLLGWFHWIIGLVAAGILGKNLARSMQRRKISVHYPLIATASYCCMMLANPESSVSTPLGINIGIAVLTGFLITQMIPKRNVRTIDAFEHEAKSPHVLTSEKARTFTEKLEQSYTANAAVGCLGVLFLIHQFKHGSHEITPNLVIFILLTLGLLLHRNPASYARAITNSVKCIPGIMIQFPFYGGVMAILRDSGLGTTIVTYFTVIATKETLPLLAYLSSALIKIFIPISGANPVFEGKLMLEAASKLGASAELTSLGIAYGKMIANMVQPFWTVPLLSIMGLKPRDIMGYCLVIFFFVFPTLAVALWRA